jgi:hypothetical protein
MSFSFHRKGYVEDNIDHITSIDLDIGGYRDSEVLNTSYSSQSKAIGLASEKLKEHQPENSSYSDGCLGVIRDKGEFEVPLFDPISQDNNEMVWYKTFINWLGRWFR